MPRDSVISAIWHTMRHASAHAVLAGFVLAGVATLPAGAQEPDVSVELNKLEPQEKGCRAYVVVANGSDTTYQSFKLDLVLFGTDGIIAKRFALDLAPLKGNKRTVKLFDLDSVACDGVGSFLVNDVLECRSEAGAVADCLARIKVSSLTKAQIAK